MIKLQLPSGDDMHKTIGSSWNYSVDSVFGFVESSLKTVDESLKKVTSSD